MSPAGRPVYNGAESAQAFYATKAAAVDETRVFCISDWAKKIGNSKQRLKDD